MAFGNFESPSPDKKNKDEQTEKQAESAVEESVGKNAEHYKDAAGITHNTFALRDQLDEKTLKKLEKLKQEQSDGSSVDDQGESDGKKKAA